MLLAIAAPTSLVIAAAQKNDITKLGIKELPKGNTINLDSEENFFNFDPEIIQTKLGKGSTTGVVWWEVNQATNTASVVSSRYGYMYPVYAGSFEIRALAFTNTKTMEAWKKDKIANAKYITASTSWVKINVVSEKEGYAVARSQSQLNAALANRDCTDIVIKTDKETNFTINPYNYTRRTLTVNAPNAEVTNFGRFKQINVEQIKKSTFFERAIGNLFHITAPNARLVVGDKAQIKNIIFAPKTISSATPKLNIVGVGGSISSVNIAAKGDVNISGNTEKAVPVVIEESAAGTKISAEVKLVVDVNADVIIETAKAAVEAIINLLKPVKTTITGEAANVKVNVEKEAAGAEITTEVAVEVSAKADVKVEANKGAENTVIRADEGVKVDTTNNTDKEIVNTDLDGNNPTTVKPGESSTVTTDPEPTPEAPMVPATPPSTPDPETEFSGTVIWTVGEGETAQTGSATKENSIIELNAGTTGIINFTLGEDDKDFTVTASSSEIANETTITLTVKKGEEVISEFDVKLSIKTEDGPIIEPPLPIVTITKGSEITTQIGRASCRERV